MRERGLEGELDIYATKLAIKGLLSEILKQNCSPRGRSQEVLRFVETNVEHRPLSVYDLFSGGIDR